MSVSNRGPEVNFFSEYREPIMDRRCFVGLFLRGVARQANAAAGMMMRGAWRSGVRVEADMKDARRNSGTRFKFGRGTSSRSYERRNYSVCATTAFVFAFTAAWTWLIAPHLFPSRSGVARRHRAMVVLGAEVCGFWGWVGERNLGKVSQFCRM